MTGGLSSGRAVVLPSGSRARRTRSGRLLIRGRRASGDDRAIRPRRAEWASSIRDRSIVGGHRTDHAAEPELPLPGPARPDRCRVRSPDVPGTRDGYAARGAPPVRRAADGPVDGRGVGRSCHERRNTESTNGVKVRFLSSGRTSCHPEPRWCGVPATTGAPMVERCSGSRVVPRSTGSRRSGRRAMEA